MSNLPITLHVFASHTWKKTKGWKEARKDGYGDTHVCICCGALRSRNRTTLKSAYLVKGSFTVAAPLCEYDGSTAEQMEQFKLRLPFFPADWDIERQRRYVEKTGHHLPLREPSKSLDELLKE